MNSVFRKSLGLVLVIFLMVLGLSGVKIVRAEEYDLTTSIAYDVTNTVAITGDWVNSGTIVGANTAQSNVTVNGDEYTSVKSANVKGAVLTYSIPDIKTVKAARITLYVVKTSGSKTGVVTAVAKSGETELSSESENLETLNATGSYSNVVSTIENNNSSIITIYLDSATEFDSIVLSFAGTANMLLTKIILSCSSNQNYFTAPEVTISTNVSSISIGNTANFTYTTRNIQNPGDPTWTSSETGVATIDSSGVLHPVSVGATNISATVSGTLSNSVAIKVFPNSENPITISEALDVAELTGSTATTDSYTCFGVITFIDANNLSLSDGVNSITVYKYGHGYTTDNDEVNVQIVGKIKTFSSTKEFTDVTITRAYEVTLNPNNNTSTTTLMIPQGGKVARPTPNPTKDGYEFVSWQYNSVDWNFDTDTVSSDMEIIAIWNLLGESAHEDFQALTTKASLKVDFTSQLGAEIFTKSFLNVATLPDNGWVGDVSGVYNATGFQSFRANGKYVQSPEYAFPYSFNVSVTYYIQTLGESGNCSSKIRVIGLDQNDHEVYSCLSQELNFAPAGSSNVRTLNVKVNGEGIKKIKLVFVKDGGGNIAFSTITANALSYTLDKEDGKNLVSLRFAGMLSSTLLDRLNAEGTTVTFGMIYGATASFESRTANEICTMLNNGSLTNESLATMGIRKRAMALTGVNAAGTEEVLSNAEYYQLGISINLFSDANLGTSYKAFAFVCIDGTYYAMGERSFSVYSLAQAYVDALDTSSYAEYLGVLSYLGSQAE